GDALGWVGVSAVVLDGAAADDLTPAQRRSAVMYVQQLGGLLILTNLGAAAAPELLAMAPLSVDPPRETERWVVLIDASGSMARAGAVSGDGAGRRFDAAIAAARGVVLSLASNSRVSVALFSDELTWWVRDAALGDAAPALRAAPPVSPRGPTNLSP